MRKITMQDVADALNISRVTVWKVFNNQPGVSDALCSQILEKAKEIGYFKRGGQTQDNSYIQPSLDELSPSNPMTVSVVVSRPESSIFWMNIIHQIAKELDKSNINLMYTYLPSKANKGYTLPNVLTTGSIQGIIVLNVYDHELLNLLNQLRLPKIFLDLPSSISPNTLTGDLCLIEGKSSIYSITDHLIKQGCREIGFIGDTNYARTNMDRYEGFQNAMTDNNLTVNSDYCLTSNIGIYTYAEEINNFLSNIKQMPRAFVCVSDYVAHFVLKHLSDHNYSVPDDIAVSGFDCSTEYPDIAGKLTTVEVNTPALGIRLAKQLLYRIFYPDAPTEMNYIMTKVVYGETSIIK
jgi:LacI family transcriptional regulator